MNLTCPKCSSEDTQKLSLVMSQGGVAEKGAQLGASYGLNIMLPAMTVIFSILIGIMFAMANPILGPDRIRRGFVWRLYTPKTSQDQDETQVRGLVPADEAKRLSVQSI